MSTFVTSTLSSAQPVTGIAPATPVALSVGVSKLPNGLPAEGVEMATWICLGDPIAFGAVTVIMPLGPGFPTTWNAPFPAPDPCVTTTLGWFEVAVQANAAPPVKLTFT